MIKERKEKYRKDKKKDFINELLGYLRTATISFLAATVFTILLSFHARSEMIKNLYVQKGERLKFERQLAQKIVAHSDYTKSLSDSNYSICLQVGRLYETAGDYHKAEYAYYLAMQKAPSGVYTPYYKLVVTLIELGKIEEAEKLINQVQDTSDINLIRFKTRAYIVLGDKYMSGFKFLKAAEHYEKANYYYSRLKRQDKVVKKSLEDRLVNSYIETAGVIVKNGYNRDAVRFLNKALRYDPDNNIIKYRLAIIYADLDPVKSVELFEYLMEKIPQNIDPNVYNTALIKAANINDIEGNSIKSKFYRYRIHSIDLFINNKVIYKDEIETYISSFEVKKVLFRYKIKAVFKFQNNSARDINKMTAEFVLRQKEHKKDERTVHCVSKKNPLYSNGAKTKDIEVSFWGNIFTRKDLESYYIDIYLYKDPKFKTFVGSFKLPSKSFYPSN